MTSRRAPVAITLVIALAVGSGCGGGREDGTDSVTPTGSTEVPGTTDPSVAAQKVVAATIGSFDPDDPAALDAAIAEATALDREIDLAMADLEGITQELGGPEATAAAFAAADERAAELSPILQSPAPLGFRRGQPAQPDVTMGLVGGVLAVGLGSQGVIAATNNGQTGSSSSDGVTVTANGETLELQLDMTHESAGLTSTLKATIKILPCPDANGEFVIEATVDTSSSAAAGSKAQRGTLHVTTTGRLDDNADLAGHASEFRFKRDGLGWGSFVETSMRMSSDGPASATLDDFNWFTTTPEQMRDNAQLMAVLGVLVEKFVLDAAMSGIRAGRCVDLQLAASPGPTGLDPSSTATISARPRSKVDGSPTGGTVTALLSAGEQAVDPSSTPLAADAEFTYTASSEHAKSGTVALESRSKRGIGRAEITLDTSQPAAYQVVGGLDDWQTNTAVCDIMAPFTLTGLVTMSLSGGLSGTYEYSGGPFGAAGSGTYTISLPDGPGQPGTMTGSGVGSVDTPLGQYSDSGTEQYTLTPIEPCH